MSGRTRQGRRIAAAVALGVTLLGGGPATAGIVVLKNGEVLIGRINADEVDAEGVTLRWPYGKRSTSGRMRVPVERLRWFDASGDTLTDAYFAKHVAEPLIGGRWRRLQEEYKLRQEPVDDPVPPPPVILVDELLDWIATPGDGFEIRKPRGWSATEEDGILVLLGPRGSGGHPPGSTCSPRRATRA